MKTKLLCVNKANRQKIRKLSIQFIVLLSRNLKVEKNLVNFHYSAKASDVVAMLRGHETPVVLFIVYRLIP